MTTYTPCMRLETNSAADPMDQPPAGLPWAPRGQDLTLDELQLFCLMGSDEFLG